MSKNPAATLVDADGMAVVGRTRHDLMGIRYEGGEGGNGGDGGAGAGAGAGTGSEGAGSGTEGAGAGTGTEGAPGAGEGEQNQPTDGDIWDDPAKAKAEIERLRRERGDERIQAKKDAADEARKELLKEFTKLIDPSAADADTPTVETLTATLAQKDEAIRDAQFELAVFKYAAENKLDAGKITNSRSFFNATKDLNPSEDGFADKLTAAVNAEVTKDSSLRLGAGRSGAETHGGAGDQQNTITQEQFDAMSVEELTNLYRTNKPEYDRLSAS